MADFARKNMKDVAQEVPCQADMTPRSSKFRALNIETVEESTQNDKAALMAVADPSEDGSGRSSGYHIWHE